MIDMSKIYKLGFGLMRLPEKKDGSTDVGRVSKMVDAYMAQVGEASRRLGKNGVLPYFDTAYVYGDSEEVIGKALVKRYPRDSFLLTSKLAPWPLQNVGDCDRQFNEQLTRCGVDYFDLVMESVKGGTLARLTPELVSMLKAVRPSDSAASWALRFVASLPGVMVALSGMSDEEQMADNLKTFKNKEQKQVIT
jgi:predicted aldo/keto reductase-like oxidoreductase